MSSSQEVLIEALSWLLRRDGVAFVVEEEDVALYWEALNGVEDDPVDVGILLIDFELCLRGVDVVVLVVVVVVML